MLPLKTKNPTNVGLFVKIRLKSNYFIFLFNYLCFPTRKALILIAVSFLSTIGLGGRGIANRFFWFTTFPYLNESPSG